MTPASRRIPAYYRAWTRCRRPMVDEWLQFNDDPTFAVGPGKHAVVEGHTLCALSVEHVQT